MGHGQSRKQQNRKSEGIQLNQRDLIELKWTTNKTSEKGTMENSRCVHNLHVPHAGTDSVLLPSAHTQNTTKNSCKCAKVLRGCHSSYTLPSTHPTSLSQTHHQHSSPAVMECPDHNPPTQPHGRGQCSDWFHWQRDQWLCPSQWCTGGTTRTSAGVCHPVREDRTRQDQIAIHMTIYTFTLPKYHVVLLWDAGLSKYAHIHTETCYSLCYSKSMVARQRHAVQPLHRLIHHDFSDPINRSNHSHSAVSWRCFSTRSTLRTYRAEHHCNHYLCHCRRGGPTLSHLLYHAHKALGKSSGTHTYHHRNHNSLHHTTLLSLL